MSIATGLRTHLINNAAVAALVSDRVYPMRLPQGYSLPAISYNRISSLRPHDLNGPIGRVRIRVQVDCWADGYIAARVLADKVRLALDGFKGTLGSETNVGGVRLVSDRDGFDEETEESRVILEFLIPYFETT